MAKTKTKPTDQNVYEFIDAFANSEQKKLDSFELINLMKSVSGEEAYMWGPSIIGFGSYHYKYASRHEGDAPKLGFSPRKAAFSLYVFSGLEEHRHLLNKLGKFKMSKACIYINKLSDINTEELKKIMVASLKYLDERYPAS